MPVVELEPGDYQAPDRSLPPEQVDSREAWGAYWRDSLADSGIVGIDPLEPNTWNVALDQLSTEHLRTICKVEFPDLAPGPDLEDGLQALAGGFALVQNGVVRMTPGCCCGLAEFDDWQRLTATPPEDWEMLWIGHPWVSVRRRDARMEFSQFHEGEKELEAQFSVDLEDLVLAVAQVPEALAAFADRVEPILAERLSAFDANKAARIVAGLAE